MGLDRIIATLDEVAANLSRRDPALAKAVDHETFELLRTRSSMSIQATLDEVAEQLERLDPAMATQVDEVAQQLETVAVPLQEKMVDPGVKDLVSQARQLGYAMNKTKNSQSWERLADMRNKLLAKLIKLTGIAWRDLERQIDQVKAMTTAAKTYQLLALMPNGKKQDANQGPVDGAKQYVIMNPDGVPFLKFKATEWKKALEKTQRMRRMGGGLPFASAENNMKHKKEIISVLIKAGKPELANAVSKDITAAGYNLVLMKSPKGTWIFRGSVPVELSYERKDGKPLSEEDINDLRYAQSPGMLKHLRTRSWKSQEDAAKEAKRMKVKIDQISGSKSITAKKAHFNPSQWVREYEDEVGLIAQNNYGAWKDTNQAEQFVKKAIRDVAKAKYDDVVESFKGKDDVKYIVETYLYGDDPDPYNLEPPDPKVGKSIEKALQKLLGKDYKSWAGTRADKGQMHDGSNKAWQVWIEGHPKYDVDNFWGMLSKALGRGYSMEIQDDVTMLVIPDE